MYDGPAKALLPALTMLLLLSGSGSAEVIASAAVPFEQLEFVDCANGGVGEEVLLTGFLHVLVTETVDAHGSLHTTAHVQPMGATAIGLTTGDLYRATGVTREAVNGLEIPFEATFVNNFRIVGPGKGNNLLIHQVFHVTVNAEGEVAVLLEHVSAECK